MSEFGRHPLAEGFCDLKKLLNIYRKGFLKLIFKIYNVSLCFNPALYMTLSEFNHFDLNQKSDLVWEWGHYLTSRKTETHNIVLFLVNDFLAEVHIALTDNKTTDVIGILKTELHSDFKTLMNNDDPFIKALWEGKHSSSQQKSA